MFLFEKANTYSKKNPFLENRNVFYKRSIETFHPFFIKIKQVYTLVIYIYFVNCFESAIKLQLKILKSF